MSQAKDRRQRAVRLTDEGLELLRARMAEKWERRGYGKLTRAAKAELLEVSVGTAERILNQRGNDRAVLIQAFERLGLRWEDRYCELREMEIGDDPAEGLPPPPPSRRRVWIAAVATALGLFLFTLKNQPPEDPHGPVSQALDVSRQAYQDAEYATARSKVREAFRMAQAHAMADQMAYCMDLEGEILAAQGDLTGAVKSYNQSRVFWGSLENPHGLASLLERLAVAEARLGRLDDAERNFKEALNVAKNVKDPGVTGGILRGLGSTEAIRGNFAAAHKWYDAATFAIKGPGQEPMQLDLNALRALLDRDEGKHGEALKRLQECLDAWTKIGQPRWIAATLLQIGSVHSAMGDQVLARKQISEARRLYESVGDRRGIDLCTRWLASTGTFASHESWRLEEYF